MSRLWPVFLYIVPFCIMGNIERGAPLWLSVPAFVSILLGWYMGRREGVLW